MKRELPLQLRGKRQALAFTRFCRHAQQFSIWKQPMNILAIFSPQLFCHGWTYTFVEISAQQIGFAVVS